MAFPWKKHGSRQKQLDWNDFAATHPRSHSERSTTEIVQCLLQILEEFEESEFIKYLVAPSPNSLATYFKTSVSHVYQALKTLEENGYGAEASNHYAPIMLWDPQVRDRTSRYIRHSGIEKIPQIESTD